MALAVPHVDVRTSLNQRLAAPGRKRWTSGGEGKGRRAGESTQHVMHGMQQCLFVICICDLAWSGTIGYVMCVRARLRAASLNRYDNL